MLDEMMSHGTPASNNVVVQPEGIVTRQSTDILMLADADLAQAVRIIREQACRGVRVSQVAEAVCMSRRALEQRFRKAFGRTPKEEILRLQIDRAKQLLRETTLRIEQIAERSGFRAFKYFARAFRREAGQTPRAYRETHFAPISGISEPACGEDK